MGDLVFAKWGMTMRTPEGPVDLVPLHRRLEGDMGARIVADERPAAILALTHMGTPIDHVARALNMSHTAVKAVLTEHGMKPVVLAEPEPIVWKSLTCTSNAERRNKRRAERVLVGDRLIHQGEQTPHGTDTGYAEFGCQCDPCTVAHAAKLAAYRIKKKQARAAA